MKVVFLLLVLVAAALAMTDAKARALAEEHRAWQAATHRSHELGRSAAQVRDDSHIRTEVTVHLASDDADRIDPAFRTATPGAFRMPYAAALRYVRMGIKLELDDDSAADVGVPARRGGGDAAAYQAPAEAFAELAALASDRVAYLDVGVSHDGLAFGALCVGPHGRHTVLFVHQHGEELLAYEVGIRLAHALAGAEKGRPFQVTQDRRVCVLATANPDGVKAVRRCVQAGDACVDPNRNFPLTERLLRAGRTARVPEEALRYAISSENQALLRFIEKEGVVAVWALHAGARGVFSLPRDAGDVWAPRWPFRAAPMPALDQRAVEQAASEFCGRVKYFRESRVFPRTQGMVVGSQWYPIRGGLCDALEERGVSMCGYIEFGPKIVPLHIARSYFFREAFLGLVELAAAPRFVRVRLTDGTKPIEGTLTLAEVAVRARVVDDAAARFAEAGGFSTGQSRAVATRGGVAVKAFPKAREGYRVRAYAAARGCAVRAIDLGEADVDVEISLKCGD